MSKTNQAAMADLFQQSSITTLIAHLPRVGLNIVSASESKPTPKEFFIRAAKALPYNYTRGTGIFFTQLAARNTFPDYPFLAPIVTGTLVSTILETPTIIKTNTDSKLAVKPAFTRFGVALTGCYFLREAGFVCAIMSDKNASPWVNGLNFGAGVLVSSSFHKFAVLQAIKDMPNANLTTVPQLREGPRLIANIAKGHYTHRAFAVPYPQPSTYWQAGINLAKVIFPPHVVAARACYLAVFKGAFFMANPANRTWAKDYVQTTLGSRPENR